MENAHLFFPIQEGQDPDDLYDELMFKDKQFFTQKAVHPKLFLGKITKLQLREQAFVSITGSPRKAVLEKIKFSFNSSSVLTQYESFLAAKQQIYQKIYLANSLPTLVHLIETLIKVFRSYAQFFTVDGIKELKIEVPQSKEMDGMRLDAAIRTFTRIGGEQPADINDLEFEGKSELIKEFKRLSLLSKLNKEWQTLSRN